MVARRLELDAPALKALAHPLRVQMLRVIQLRKQVSVTSLAAELGETTGATSYHLRQLARHGFVEQFEPADEASPKRPGRQQRWWRMAVEEIHSTGFEFLADENTREAFSFLMREDLAERGRRHANWFATAPDWPVAWQRASSDLDMHVELDPAQTRALADELRAVVTKYRELKPGRGAHLVDVQYAVFPTAVHSTAVHPTDTGNRP